MGYLIQESSTFPISKVTVTIPTADVLTLATNPITIVPSGTGLNYLIVASIIQVGRQTVPYTGVSHIYLTDNATIKWGIIETVGFGGTITEASYSFALNMTHPPNRFGIRISSTKPILIQTNANPSAGDGNWTVTLYYLSIADI